MIHTVSFNGKSTFMKGAKGITLRQFDTEGELKSESAYKQPFLPGVGRSYIPRIRGGKVMIDMPQSDLDNLVKELKLYDDRGNEIVSAPIHNPAAPFWRHSAMRLQIDNAGINIDDGDALGKIWLAVFRADQIFAVGNVDENPAMDGVIKFKVVEANEHYNERSKDIDEVTKATELLYVMDYEKQTNILIAMGTHINNADPVQVKRKLTEKIVHDKDKITQSGERNIELFFRLAKATSTEMNIRETITKAQNSSRKLIVRAKGRYLYGELPLGRTIEEVYQFLSSDINKDILADIVLKLGGSN